jgi:hypothetical protein
MLRFLILGLIPGTSIQIEFWQVLILLVLVLTIIESYVHYRLLPEYQEFKKLGQQKTDLYKA